MERTLTFPGPVHKYDFDVAFGPDADLVFEALDMLPPYFPSPFKPVPVCDSEADIPNCSGPFIFHNFPGLPRTEARFVQFIVSEAEIYGYGKVPKDNGCDWDEQTLTGRQVWELYRRGALPFNIVDSECSGQDELLTTWNLTRLNKPSFLGWVLTNAPATTCFHTDPPYGDCFMYLIKGKKIWLFLAPADLDILLKKYDYTHLNSLSIPELLALENHFLRGRLYAGLMQDGDFLFFPENWPHHVRTLENSFGFGGYIEKNRISQL